MCFQITPEDNFFEGCEKVLDVTFSFGGHDSRASLRNIPRSELDMLVGEVKASIISTKSSETIDSYVLSESSLFLWKNRILLKTCGTTVPLLAIEKLFIVMKKHIGIFEVERVSYSRKCYFQPENQVYPHKTQQQEMDYLKMLFPTGVPHTFNENSEFEWILFVYNRELPSEVFIGEMQFGFQIMMWKLEEKQANKFYMQDDISFCEMTQKCKIDNLIPSSDLDGFVFDPCGYSMNGLKGDCFQTIHVTPQAHCSYASYETNSSLRDVPELIRKTNNIFKPQKMIISYFCPKSMAGELNHSLLEIGLETTSVKDVECPGGIIKYSCYDMNII